MSAIEVQLAEAVKGALIGGGLQDVVVQRVWFGEYEPENFTTRTLVQVRPFNDEETEHASRGCTQRDIVIEVFLMRKLSGNAATDNQTIDTVLCDLRDQVRVLLDESELPLNGQMYRPIKPPKSVLMYDVEALRAKREWQSLFAVTYREFD